MYTCGPAFFHGDAGSDPGGPEGYQVGVTIASGTVSSDLTGFPLMVDLSDMPAGFWTDVRSDGGNIRAYLSDGTTLVPHDVTYINTAAQEGRMFIRTDIASGSDTVVVVGVLDSSTTGLAVGDTNGQYAVWADFDAVVVFPDTVNRKDGGALTSVGSQGGTFEWTETAQQSYTADQGVVFDGTYHYAVETDYLRKYSTGTTIVASNTNPCGDMNTATGETTLNHCGSPAIIDGELWVPIEVYPAGTYNKQYIGRFSLTDMSFIGYIQLTGASREISGLVLDSANSRIYLTDFTDGASIPYYDKTTGVYGGALTLSSTLTEPQGICAVGTSWFVSYSGGVVAVDPAAGTVGDSPFTDWYGGIKEGITSYNDDTLVYLTGTNARTFKRVTRCFDWRRQHGTVSYLTVPTATVWTAAVSWKATPALLQQGITGVNVTGDSSIGARTSVNFRSTGTLVAIWNSTDSWLNTSPSVGVTSHGTYRVAIQHDGTTARRVFANGAVTLDSGCANRPASGTNMDWFFGASNAANTEPGYGYYQYAWLRKSVMSTAWMAADAANMNSPATFYSAAEL